MRVLIERLGDLLHEDFSALLADSERAGVGFVRRLADEWASGTNRFARPGEALFGARVGGELVGVCGLNVDPYATLDRDGRVRHLYVRVSHRRLGVGGRLVEAIVDAARGRFDRLRLRTSNPEAARLYERLGFHRRDDVLHCTHVKEMRA